MGLVLAFFEADEGLNALRVFGGDFEVKESLIFWAFEMVLHFIEEWAQGMIRKGLKFPEQFAPSDDAMLHHQQKALRVLSNQVGANHELASASQQRRFGLGFWIWIWQSELTHDKRG